MSFWKWPIHPRFIDTGLGGVVAHTWIKTDGCYNCMCVFPLFRAKHWRSNHSCLGSFAFLRAACRVKMLRNHIRRRVSKRANSNDQALSIKNLQGYQTLMAIGRSCSLKRTAVAWPLILVWPYGQYSSTFFDCLMINPAASCVYHKTCQNLNLEQNQHMPDHASR